MREAAARVAGRADVPETWLNDAVKAYLGSNGEFEPYLELPNLRVFVARPEYLLAMKCVAMRLGAEFHDLAATSRCHLPVFRELKRCARKAVAADAQHWNPTDSNTGTRSARSPPTKKWLLV